MTLAAVLPAAAPARAELTTEQVEHLAVEVAAKLAATCPRTAYDDHKAFAARQAAYRVT